MLLFLSIPQMPHYSKLCFCASSQISPSLPCTASLLEVLMEQLFACPVDIHPQHMPSQLSFTAANGLQCQSAGYAPGFATPVLPSDAKCFVEEGDLNTLVRVHQVS